MLKVFSLLFLLTTSIASGQNIDGFMGMKFGSSSDVVKKIMLDKPDCTLDKKNSTITRMVFDGIRFAGRKTLFVALSFIDDKLFNGSAYFKPDLESKTLDLYNEMREEINEKYYSTEFDFETYKSPYAKGDGHTEMAIKLGKANFAAFWTGKDPTTGVADSNAISLEISESLFIVLNYQDGKLARLNTIKTKEKNSADY